MKFVIETEQEDDGRWIAEVVELPGVLAYGISPSEARARAQALALRVVAERLEHAKKTDDFLPCTNSPSVTHIAGPTAVLRTIGFQRRAT